MQFAAAANMLSTPPTNKSAEDFVHAIVIIVIMARWRHDLAVVGQFFCGALVFWGAPFIS